MSAKRDQNGFTLVELMVVVLIIGVLVAIALPVFNASSRSARLRTCQSNQRAIEGALRQYEVASGDLPGAGRLNGSGAASTADVLVPGYIKDAPKCPETDLFYWIDATGTVTGDTSVAGFTPGHSHY